MKNRLKFMLLCICVTAAMTACSKKADAPQGETKEEQQTENSEGETAEESAPAEDSIDMPAPVVLTAKYFAGIYDDYYNEDGSVNEEYIGTLADISCEYPYVITEGYEKLKGALRAYSDKAVKDTMNSRMEMEKEITEARGTESFQYMGLPWGDETSISLLRADNRVVSFWENLMFNLGGAHPSYGSSGMNFDSQTGEILKLDAIATDYDGIYEYVMNYLETFPDHDGLFPEYADSVKDCFYPTNSINGVNWAFTNDGLSIIFNPYHIGPFAMGQVEVQIPSEELDRYIDAKYLPKSEPTVWQIYPYETTAFDVDGDGVNEELIFHDEPYWDEEYRYSNGFDLKVEFGKTGDLKSVTDEGELEFDSAYLMKTDGGKYYLYVQSLGNNDWMYLMVYDLNDPAAGPKRLDEYVSGSFYAFTPMDSDSFYLSYRLEVLGTRQGYRRYKLGENGLPEALEEMWKIETFDYPNYYEDFDTNSEEVRFPLVALQDLEGIDGKISEGERAGVRYALIDEFGYPKQAVLEKQNGEIITIEFDEQDPDRWVRLLDGKPEYEVFDGVMYAG